jgi:selenocysteine lyase/cysteine desulfurase
VDITTGDFPGARGYLDTATLGLPCAATLAELQLTLADWQAGTARPAAYDDHVRRSREAFARLAGIPADCVAAAGQVSSFVALVAASLPAGARVLAPEGEFTSVLFPFLARGDLRVTLAPLASLPDAVTPETALVAFSAVQSADGAVADREAIRAAAVAAGARTLVDVTQAAGWQPIAAQDADYLVCGTYKWLLSPRGTAFLAGSRERLEELPALHAGWYAGADPWTSIYGAPLRLAENARRLDLSPAWLCWAGTAPALEFVERLGVAAIGAHDVALAARVRAAAGLPENGSAIVSLPLDDAASERLRAAGARFSVRDGRARLSFHLYSDDTDVDLVLTALGLG